MTVFQNNFENIEEVHENNLDCEVIHHYHDISYGLIYVKKGD